MEKSFAISKYVELSEHGSRLNLSFSCHLVLGNKIVALDGIRKCLLILDTCAATEHLCFVDLNDIATVTLRKVYGSINHEELEHKVIQDFLKKIELQFKFRNKNETIILPFYDSSSDALADRQKLEKNAISWQKMLSKMLGSQLKEMSEKDNI